MTSVTEQVAFFSSSRHAWSRSVTAARGSQVALVTRLYPKHPTGQDLGHHGLAPPPPPPHTHTHTPISAGHLLSVCPLLDQLRHFESLCKNSTPTLPYTPTSAYTLTSLQQHPTCTYPHPFFTTLHTHTHSSPPYIPTHPFFTTLHPFFATLQYTHPFFTTLHTHTHAHILHHPTYTHTHILHHLIRPYPFFTTLNTNTEHLFLTTLHTHTRSSPPQTPTPNTRSSPPTHPYATSLDPNTPRALSKVNSKYNTTVAVQL